MMWFPCNVSSSFCPPGMLSSSTITASCFLLSKYQIQKLLSDTSQSARDNQNANNYLEKQPLRKEYNDFTMTSRIDALIQFKTMYSLFFKCMQFEINITKLRIIGNSDSDIYIPKYLKCNLTGIQLGVLQKRYPTNGPTLY